MYKRLVLSTLLFAAYLSSANAQESITPEDAHQYLGKHVVVCGTVANTKYAPARDGAPTFIDFGQSYPNQVFTAIVWGEDRSNFSYKPEELKGKNICVSGLVESDRNHPAISVSEPSQISQNK